MDSYLRYLLIEPSEDKIEKFVGILHSHLSTVDRDAIQG